MKVRHDGNEVTFTSNNLHADGNLYSRHSCNYSFIPVNVEKNLADHFIMRLLVGSIVNSILHNKVDYCKRWFQVSESEKKIYEKLGVKKWKNKMPTYRPDWFDPRLHSWKEIAQIMCQSEVGHEIIAVLSFLPVFAGIKFGAYPVFIITSIVSAGMDLIFVIMQRYNRQRIMRILAAKK